MCDECLMTFCPQGCPNYPEPIPVHYCSECKSGIYDGDTYYKIEGKKYCIDCIDDSRNYAEYEDPRDYD